MHWPPEKFNFKADLVPHADLSLSGQEYFYVLKKVRKNSNAIVVLMFGDGTI